MQGSENILTPSQGHQVLKFSPSDLSYVSISAQMNSEEKSPEGIAFSKGCMYIAR